MIGTAPGGVFVQHVLVEHYYRAPIDRVWARYTDHVSWTDWAGLGSVRLAKQGAPTPNGVGCVREISSAGVKVHKAPSTVDITMALQKGRPLFRFRFSGS